MEFTRRDFGKIALASVPLYGAFGAKRINSTFGGVQVGAITYSFNRIASPDPEAIIKAYVEIGLGEAELMSNHCEALAGAPAMPTFGRGGGAGRGPGGPGPGGAPPAGAPPAGAPPAQGGAARGAGGGRAQLTPEQQAERQAATEKLAKWRASTSAGTWKAVAKKFDDAGIDVALLCYNMQDTMKDEDIEYGFSMAEGLGVKGITTSTTLTISPTNAVTTTVISSPVSNPSVYGQSGITFSAASRLKRVKV